MVDPCTIFKRKAVELASKLQARFPSKLMFVVPMVERASEDEMFDSYIEYVHEPYGDRIAQRDETFFLTTDGLEDPMQMVQMLRGLWTHMNAEDKDAVWKYMHVFERLASMPKVHRAGTA